MKKAAIWIAVLSGVILAIAMLAMGIGVYEMDENVIRITAYIALPCWAFLFAAVLVLRFGSPKCPYCGRHIPSNGTYCPYCGKESNNNMKKILCKIVSIVMFFLTILAILGAATVTGSGVLDLSNIVRYFLIGFALVFGITAVLIGRYGWNSK